MTAPTPGQQSILDTQWNRVADKVTVHQINETNFADLLYHGPSDLGRALSNTHVKSRVDGNLYPLVNPDGDGYLAGIDEKVNNCTVAVEALSAKVDQLITAVAALAPHPA